MKKFIYQCPKCKREDICEERMNLYCNDCGDNFNPEFKFKLVAVEINGKRKEIEPKLDIIDELIERAQEVNYKNLSKIWNIRDKVENGNFDASSREKINLHNREINLMFKLVACPKCGERFAVQRFLYDFNNLNDGEHFQQDDDGRWYQAKNHSQNGVEKIYMDDEELTEAVYYQCNDCAYEWFEE